MSCGYYETKSGKYARFVSKFDGACGADYAIISLIGVASVVNLALIALILFFREWPPIKTKQPLLMSFSLLGGTLWILSCLPINGHTSGIVRGAFWEQCWLFGYLGYLPGFTVWISSLLTRMLRLFFSFRLNRKPPLTWILMTFVMAPSLFIIIPGLTAGSYKFCTYVVTESGHVEGVTPEGRVPDPSSSEFQGCCLCTEWSFVTIALVLFYYSVFIYLCGLLRKIRTAYNEYREMQMEGILGFIALVITWVLLYLPTAYTCIGRFFISLCVLLVVIVPYYYLMVPVLYRRLFNKKIAEIRFARTVQKDGENAVRQRLSR